MEIPQLDEGRFEELTISGQLRVIERAVGDEPAILIGLEPGRLSGGALRGPPSGSSRAAGAARAGLPVSAALAGALFGPGWERWKREGSTPVFHYGDGRERRLGYQFVEDAAQYEDEPEFPQPALILHGVRDSVVPAGISSAYAARRPECRAGSLGIRARAHRRPGADVGRKSRTSFAVPETIVCGSIRSI